MCYFDFWICCATCTTSHQRHILAHGEHFVPQCSLLCSLPTIHTHINTHAADGLLFHFLPSTSPPPQIPPWLTARAQRQVEWHLSCLSLSSHHLSSSPTAPVSYWEREEKRPAKPTSTFHLSAGCMTRHQAALLYL